jgi:hypothetical protein
MAATAATLFSVTPLAGIDLDAKSSTPAFALLTLVNANDGKHHVYARASEALSSTTTVLIRSLGSASSDAGSAGWTSTTTGGVAAGQYFWANRVAV